MRAGFVGAVVLLLASMVSPAEGRLQAHKFGEPTCEEQCREDGVRDDATCDDAPMHAQSRVLCHEQVKARIDVCLRICED
jgi:hypothetical protein